MRWPEIFFKAKSDKRPEDGQAAAPIDNSPKPMPAPEDAASANPPGVPEGIPPSLRTPPKSTFVSHITLPPAPVHMPTSDMTVIQDMEEADTLRAMTRSGGVRLVKREFPPLEPGTEPPPVNPVAPPTAPRPAPSINLSGTKDLPSAAALPPGVTIFRRRTKMADVARIVLPPRRDESAAERGATSPAPEPPPEPVPSSTVIPASFPVAVATGSVLQTETPTPALEIPAEEKSDPEKDTVSSQETMSAAPIEETFAEPAPVAEEKTNPAPEPTPEVPSPAPESKEEPAPPPDDKPPTTLATAREKREFVLSNGERILGHILSETPEAFYIDHGTLGVLTIPRAQIAQRPVEIILINGDRIVGDIVAETADSLFVRHASLGILTVPNNQRSTRVVEAILNDGDRILGEVLAETENFTVIRSATLGTVAVPHNRVAMLNRRAEQVQMKSLPPDSQLADKPAS